VAHQVQDQKEAQRVATHCSHHLEQRCKVAVAVVVSVLTRKAMVVQPVHTAQLLVEQIPTFNQASETQQVAQTVEVQQVVVAVPAVQAVVEQVAVAAAVPVLLAASPGLH
jgi:hypothetical protein